MDWSRTISCQLVGGPLGTLFRGALATLVLDVAQLSICISACACVVFVWPHCLRALSEDLAPHAGHGDDEEAPAM